MCCVKETRSVEAAGVRRTLHEPEIFVSKHAVKSENSLRLLVKDGKTLKTTLGIALVCSPKIQLLRHHDLDA